MKKFIITFFFIVLVAIVSTSCKRNCHCYDIHTGKEVGVSKSLTTKEECVGYKTCRCGVECKWEE